MPVTDVGRYFPISISVHPPFALYFFLSESLSFFLSLSIFFSNYLYLFLSVCESISFSLSLKPYPSQSIYPHLSLSPSFSLSSDLSLYLSLSFYCCQVARRPATHELVIRISVSVHGGLVGYNPYQFFFLFA